MVDASVAVKLLVKEKGSDAACQLVASGRDLHSQRPLPSEVANALWRQGWLGQIGRICAGTAVAHMPELPACRDDDEDMNADALRMALAIDHYVCDWEYLALAQRDGVAVVMPDRQLVNAVEPPGHGMVMMLSDHAVRGITTSIDSRRFAAIQF